MTKPIIVMKVKPTAFKKLVSLAEAVYEDLHLNPHFVSPYPTMAQLTTAIVATKDAEAAWGTRRNHGSSADYVHLTAVALHLHQILSQLKDWCMSSLDPTLSYSDQRVILSTSGFPLMRERMPQGPLPAVRNFHRFIARNVPEFKVKLKWAQPLEVTTPTNVKGYLVYRNKTEDFSTATLIAFVSKTTFTDEPGAGTWCYWVRAVNNQGEGVRSEIVIARIAEGW